MYGSIETQVSLRQILTGLPDGAKVSKEWISKNCGIEVEADLTLVEYDSHPDLCSSDTDVDATLSFCVDYRGCPGTAETPPEDPEFSIVEADFDVEIRNVSPKDIDRAIDIDEADLYNEIYTAAGFGF